MNFKFNKPLVLIIAFFIVFYVALSIIPHYTFNTNAFDLGIFNQALKSYSNFEIGPNTIRDVPTLFADHFEPIMLLFSPLYWIFGSYTLLLLQIAFIMFGGLGVYLLIKKKSENNEYLAIGALLIFFLNYGIIQAFAFDYHNNVIATMLVPWLFYYLSEKKFKLYYIFLFMFLFTKENMSLISIFLGISIFIFDDKEIKKHGIYTILISVLYFLASIKIIEFLNDGNYDHWSYNSLGKGPLEAIYYIITNPLDTLLFFFNKGRKLLTWALFLITGGIFALAKPKYSLLLVPVFAQKFFSDNYLHWGYTFQYSVEFAPVIAIGSVLFIKSKIKEKYQKSVLSCLVLINILIILNLNLYTGDTILRIFNAEYYKKDNHHELTTAIKIIKGAESVSAQNSIIPHLKNKNLYLFPEINNSEFVVIDTLSNRLWPFANKEIYLSEIIKMEQNNDYKKFYNKNGVIVFKLESQN